MDNREVAPPNREKAVRHSAKRALSKKEIFVTGSFDIPFLTLTMALLTIGLIMLFLASYPYSYYYEDNSYYYFIRQFVFVVVGLIAMAIISKLNYRLLMKYMKPLAVITLLLLVVVLFYHTNVRGFKRWIPLGPFTFQPSDLAKFTLVVVLATYICTNYQKMRKMKEGLIIPLIITAVFCGLVFLEHHNSCTILMMLIGLSLMWVGGSNKTVFILGVGFVIGAVIVLISFPDLIENLGYGGDRIKAWLDKDFEPTGLRWQTNNSLYAIGSGGLFGVGLGNSKQKYLYVSEPQNDFIFSIVCEELGFVGAALIIILFGALIVRGIIIASRCNDRFGTLVVMGIIAQIGLQVAFNIMVVTDTVPNTGIALPFFSYGGTAIMMLLAQIGVVLSVSRISNQRKV